MTQLALNQYPTSIEQQQAAIRLRNQVIKLTGTPKYLLAEEIKQLFEFFDNSKQQLFFQILWNTGCRKSEALNLQRKDVDLDNRIILLHTLKRKAKADRIVPIIDEVFFNLLRDYLSFSRFKAGDKLFSYTPQYINQLLDKIVLNASINGVVFPFKLSPHTFRHSFAIHLLYNGIKPIEIKKLLGHATINSTMIYLNLLVSDLDFSNIKFN